MDKELQKYISEIPGLNHNSDYSKLTMDIPSVGELEDGRVTMVVLMPGVYVMDIDIRSNAIPKVLENMGGKSEFGLLVNCCFEGRCEFVMNTGEYTYLSCNEISFGTGRSDSSFSYPSADYKGIEICIMKDALRNCELELCGYRFLAPKTMAKLSQADNVNTIVKVGDSIMRAAHGIHQEIQREEGDMPANTRGMLLLNVMEFFEMLARRDYKVEQTRTYFTKGQVQIAQETRKKILSDLSVRQSAKELAADFGISETSLKNYFKSVYGIGFLDFQEKIRNEKAEELLSTTDMGILAISQAVGFSTQSHFSAFFKKIHGYSPLEYRRRVKLKNYKS